jgi:hypothetical protein
MANKLDLSGALDAANNALTKEKEEKEEARTADEGDEKIKFITLRIRESDHEWMRRLFGGQGLPLATACTMASYWLAKEVEAGRYSISRGGIREERAKN